MIYTKEELGKIIKGHKDQMITLQDLVKSSFERDKMNDMKEDEVGCADHNEPSCVHCKTI